MNIVFASGFLFPQNLFGKVAYFRGVKERFESQHAVFFPPVPPLASSRERARNWLTRFITGSRPARSISSRIRWAVWTAVI